MFILLKHIKFSACCHPHPPVPSGCPCMRKLEQIKDEGESHCMSRRSWALAHRGTTCGTMKWLHFNLMLTLVGSCFHTLCHSAPRLSPVQQISHVNCRWEDWRGLLLHLLLECSHAFGRCFTQPTLNSLSSGYPLPPWAISSCHQQTWLLVVSDV